MTQELVNFNKKITKEIDDLKVRRSVFVGTSPEDAIARDVIDKQMKDLEDIKKLTKTMKSGELDAFEELFTALTKTHPTAILEINTARKSAQTDKKLMKALAE
jgi:hypothetical protein